MRAIILLTIFAVLPISCRLYPYNGTDTISPMESAQKILDTLQLADKTKDLDLFSSVVASQFEVYICGRWLTYDRWRDGIGANLVKDGADVKITYAVFDAKVRNLRFGIIEKLQSIEETIMFTAVRTSFSKFKISTIEVFDAPCPTRGPWDEIPDFY